METEKDIEAHFCWAVAVMGGTTWKFRSPGRPGVPDRIACLPDGSTWFVELKKPRGRLSERQKEFALDMMRLRQKYACLWDKKEIDAWTSAHTSTTR